MVGRVMPESDSDGALGPISKKVRTEQPQNSNRKWHTRGKAILERSSFSDPFAAAAQAFPLPCC